MCTSVEERKAGGGSRGLIKIGVQVCRPIKAALDDTTEEDANNAPVAAKTVPRCEEELFTGEGGTRCFPRLPKLRRIKCIGCSIELYRVCCLTAQKLGRVTS